MKLWSRHVLFSLKRLKYSLFVKQLQLLNSKAEN